jgi:hypothetical protein
MFSLENDCEIEMFPDASESLGSALNLWDDDSSLV